MYSVTLLWYCILLLHLKNSPKPVSIHSFLQLNTMSRYCLRNLEHFCALLSLDLDVEPMGPEGGTHMLDATGVWGRQGYLFHNFMNGRGIQKTEELNGRGPKMRPQTRGVSKSSHEWKGISKFSALCAITEQISMDLFPFMLMKTVWFMEIRTCPATLRMEGSLGV